MLDFKAVLMYVTDDDISNDKLFFSILESALKGGVDCIQLREKKSNTLLFYKRALLAKKICDKYKKPLIINDRVDIALAVDADGLHIGQKDMPSTIARKLLGENKIIGLSVSNIKQAEKANTLNVNYIGISPLFATTTKINDLEDPIGIEGLKKIKSITTKPLISIGGVNVCNAKQVIQNGSNGVAVVSAISKAKNPEMETKTLKKIIWTTGLIK